MNKLRSNTPTTATRRAYCCDGFRCAYEVDQAIFNTVIGDYEFYFYWAVHGEPEKHAWQPSENGDIEVSLKYKVNKALLRHCNFCGKYLVHKLNEVEIQT